MKIVIASTILPFIYGGGELIVDWLAQKLNEYGHQSEIVKIPFVHDYHTVMKQMLGLRMYHLENSCDRLIAIRTPAYLLQHPEKYLWFIHHYREMYDLWGSEYETFPRDNEVMAIREYVKRADDMAFREAQKVYSNSKIVSKRLQEYNKINAEVVYPPVLKPEQFYCNAYKDYVYYSSRIIKHKRQWLAIEAMKYVKTDVKLLLTGRMGSAQDEQVIAKLIHENRLENKVTIVDRWITEEEKAAYYADCLAAIYIPYKEDSYGYPSLEAHHSRKAVISCTDSGGTDELILDGQNGFLVEPDPQKLAEIFDRLYEDKKMAEKMGELGLQRIAELNITWDNVIGRFTS